MGGCIETRFRWQLPVATNFSKIGLYGHVYIFLKEIINSITSSLERNHHAGPKDASCNRKTPQGVYPKTSSTAISAVKASRLQFS